MKAACIREFGPPGLKQPLPLILGSELSGIVEAVGAEVAGFKPGDEVYGATNEMFTGAYVEYALASAAMVADTVITIDDLPRPTPSSGQVLVRVRAAGVGPWDALVREGKRGRERSRRF